ncbi:DUF775 domain-containing protein [Chaetomidium leptoderma]|uniref:DUF775 domain-containing protein n=1 Tax=Chaetomidium leptoderma TaxID=669021 RepID=A0AAN6VHT6_9PEZI|nr:DUF775 domain-containing protein [Chaetomidium leptoderma]
MSQQPVFGLVAAGHPLIVTPTQTPTPTTFIFVIPPAQPGLRPASSIAVFLLPGVELPPGTAAAIYLVTPPTAPHQTEPNQRLISAIGPGKESTIFRLGGSGPPPTSTTATTPGGGGGGPPNEASSSNVVIGISIEPADSVVARVIELSSSLSGSSSSMNSTSGGALVQAPAASASASRPGQQPSTLVLAQRIIKNAFNFLTGFSSTTDGGRVEVVPLRAFEEWWRKFEARVRTDPGFLERDD